MRKILATGVLAAMSLFLLLATTANAYTIIYSEPGVVTAISDVDIDGVLFNVDFDTIGGFGTYGGDVDYWAGDLGSATAALNSIRDILNAESITGVNTNSGNEYDIRVDSSLYTGVWAITHGGGVWNIGSDPLVDSFSLIAFSTTAVPIPAAVWLFGSALGGLGWMRRRKTA
jgi:hypothetical protein